MFTRIEHAWLALRGKPIIVEKIITKEVVAKRNFLGSIDKEQVQYLKNLSETERKEHVGDISNIFTKKAFGLELNSLMDTQVYWMGREADGDRQNLFGKGTLNGIQLVHERFELLTSEAKDRNKPKDNFDQDPLERYGILGEFSTKT